jgi:glucose-6-phosphate isomerase, archaeal
MTAYLAADPVWNPMRPTPGAPVADLPYVFTISSPQIAPTRFNNHITRTLGSLRGLFLDESAYARMLARGDIPVYEVYEVHRPEVSGELQMGISIVHPGKVGSEFFMTKGHFHQVLDTGEMYQCLSGEGFMVMHTPEGEAAVEALAPGRVLYIPPRWAHRSVCTSRQEVLATFFVYPGHAGHDYGTIEQDGFPKLVIEGAGGIEIIDNPRWRKDR